MKKIVILIIVLCFSVFADSRFDKFKRDMGVLRERMSEIKEKVKDSYKDSKEKWNKMAHPCEVCGKTIHTGTKCATCLSKKASESIKAGYKRGETIWRDVRPKIIEDSKKLKDFSIEASSRIADKIKDPETRENAKQVISTISFVSKKYVEAKRHLKEGTYNGLDSIGNIRIPGKFGDMSLSEIAQEKIFGKFPELQGTGIADDPAATLTAVIYHDKAFLVKEVKLLEVNGKRVSAYDAVMNSSAFNGKDTLRGLEIAASAERIRNSLDEGYIDIEAIGHLSENLSRKGN